MSAKTEFIGSSGMLDQALQSREKSPEFDVAIVIITYNSKREIGRCLRSVMEQKTAHLKSVSQQIIILDNASTDGTVELLKREFPNVHLIELQENIGFSAGVNEAARHAKAGYLLLLNPDTQVSDNAVQQALHFSRSQTVPVLVGGRALNPDGSLNPTSCWGFPTLWSLVMFATGLSSLFRRNGLLDPESLGSWDRSSVREVGLITGCFLMIPRSIWDRLEGFNERFFMYGEDADFAFRARAVGCRSLVCPDATFEHEGGLSSETPAAKMVLLYCGKVTLFQQRWRGVERTAAILLLHAGIALRASLAHFQLLRPYSDCESGWVELWRRRSEWTDGFTTRPRSASQATVPPPHAEASRIP